MIRFLNDETVAGHRHGKGAIALFDSATEAALIAAADAEDYPAVAQPVEVLSSSAVAVSCATTAVDEVLSSYTIPAGALGVNSILQIEPVWSMTSSANNKLFKVRIGSTLIYTATRTTSAKEAPLIVLANRNSLSSQVKPYDNNYVTPAATGVVTYAIDFSAAQDVEILGQRANGADALALEYYRILHFVGA